MMDVCCEINGYFSSEVLVVSLCNSEYVEDNFNDVMYFGVCFGLFYIINDSWDFLV